MTVFIVSFRRDLEMCRLAVASIVKFLEGDYRISVGVPNPDKELFQNAFMGIPNLNIFSFDEPPGKGHLAQMCVKCEADIYASGDIFMHWDSDCLLARPTKVSDFFHEGKSVFHYDYYINLYSFSNVIFNEWQDGVQRAIGIRPDEEYMRGFPILLPRDVYPKTRSLIEGHTKRRFSDYVFAQRNTFPQTFGEFNTLGTVARKYFSNFIHFQNVNEKHYWGWDRVLQFWTHGGIDYPVRVGTGETVSMKVMAKRLGLV